MVVLSPLHHEKIQHMVLYVQCGVSILQSVQIVLDTKRFGFALDRSECSVFKRPMQIPGSKIYSRIRAFQLYHTLITALTHSYSIWGCSKVWVLCINNNKVTHLHITEVRPLEWINHLCPMQLHGGNRRACSHITALLTKGKVAK